MEIKGDLRVRRTLQADRRVDSALSNETLAGNRTVSRNDYAMLNLDPNGANRNVVLPDATTLPLGWTILVRHSGSADDLVVQDNAASTLKTITAPPPSADTIMYQFVLLTNSVAAGTWSVIELGDAGTQIASKFVDTFLVADWSAPSGGYRTLTALASTHGRGTNPLYIVQETSGGNHDKVICDRERMNSSGDLELRIVDGVEFDGRIIFV